MSQQTAVAVLALATGDDGHGAVLDQSPQRLTSGSGQWLAGAVAASLFRGIDADQAHMIAAVEDDRIAVDDAGDTRPPGVGVGTGGRCQQQRA